MNVVLSHYNISMSLYWMLAHQFLRIKLVLFTMNTCHFQAPMIDDAGPMATTAYKKPVAR